MYSVSPEYLTAITKPDRTLKAKVLIGTNYTIYDEDIVDFSVERVLSNDGIPSIGAVVAAKLSLKLLNSVNVPDYYTIQAIKPYIAVITSAGEEYVPLGIFYANPNEVKRTDNVIEIECYDRFTYFETLPYTTALSYPIYLFNVLSEIETNFGVTIADKGSLPVLTVAKAPSGTLRQVLSDLAELLTANAIIGRTGAIEFKFKNSVSFHLNGSNYINFKLLSDTDIDLTKIIVEGADGEIAYQSGNTNGFSLILKNDLITSQAALDEVYNRQFPYSYYSYELNCQGMPHLDVGDVITLTDVNYVARALHIANHVLTYRGGCKSNFKAQAPKANSSSTGSTGATTLTQTIKNTITEVSYINNLLAGNITADNIAANSIDASRIDVDSLASDVAFVGSLTANEAFIDDLTANQVLVQTIAAEVGSFSEISADIITSGTLSADRIGAGSISAAKLAANTITAESGVIADAAITDANIANLSATKITAGILDAAAINVVNLNASNINTGTLNGMYITPSSVTGDKVASNAIGSANLIDGSISASKIATGAITAASGIISSIDADIITTGTLKSADGSSWIDLDNGMFNLGGKLLLSPSGFDINLTGTSLANTIDAHQASIEDMEKYLHFDAQTGLSIGQSSSPMQLTLSNDQIDFKEAGQTVAYINGQRMFISKVEILNEIIVGKHQITKYSGGNITLIKFVG